MRQILAVAAVVTLLGAEGRANQRPILYDAVALNIGVNCQWQSRCMSQQRAAMKHALSYVTKQRPPQWRVHMCNRNASRGGVRVDWIGFDHCVRNSALKPPQSRNRKHPRSR